MGSGIDLGEKVGKRVIRLTATRQLVFYYFAVECGIIADMNVNERTKNILRGLIFLFIIGSGGIIGAWEEGNYPVFAVLLGFVLLAIWDLIRS